MSLSPPPDDEGEGFPNIVIDDRDQVLSNMKNLFPDDVKIKVADGEVWANKALLSTSSDYFSAMLDAAKFKEGQEGTGGLKKYNKEVVSVVINYFHSGMMSCKDLSLSSLLHLQDLLRLLLLLPQSAKIKDFTKKKISLQKFSTPECLLGLVTADELGLATADDLLEFINNNLGRIALRRPRSSTGVKVLHVVGADTAYPVEMYDLILEQIKTEEEEIQKKMLRSLDASSFTKEELLDLVLPKMEEVKKVVLKGLCLIIYKDDIYTSDRKNNEGQVWFYPQHWKKLD